MDERLKKIETRLDLVGESLHSIDKTLVVQAGNIQEHMRRTLASEKRQALLEVHLARELAPVKRHVEGLNFLLKAIGVLSLLLSLTFTALEIYDHFTKPTKETPSVQAQRQGQGR